MKIQRETDIFISYKSEDGWNYAKDLHDALNKKGYSAFLSSNDLREGNYEQQLYKKIDECIYMIVILSPRALVNCEDEEKCWVRKEVRYALQNNKKIIPVMMYGFEWPKNLPADMEGFDKMQGVQVPYEKQYYNDSFEKTEALLKGSIKRKNRYRIVRGDKKHSYNISKKMKRNIIISLSAVLVMALGIMGGFFIIKNTKFVYDPDTMYKITLTAPEKMSVKDFDSNVEKVKKRLDILADGEKYDFQIKKDSIQIILPKKVCYDIDIEQVMKCYVSRPMELYAFNNSDESTSADQRNVKLQRSDFQSIKLKEGKVEGADTKSLGIKEDTYPYIEVVLTDECAQKLAGKISDWKDGFTFGQDLESDSYYYYDTYPQKDGKTFYIVNDDIQGKFPELMVYNWKNETTTEEFEVAISIEAEWENIDKAGQVVGKNQCNEKDLDEGTVSIVYEVDDEDLSDGEWLDTEKAIKERMDVLEQPYAFGTRRDKNKELNIVIKTGLEHMSEDIMKILVAPEGSFKIQSGLKEYSFYKEYYSAAVNQKDTQYAFSFDIKDKNEEYSKREIKKIKKLIALAKENNNNILTLMVNEIPYSNVSVDQLTEDGKIQFTDLSCWGSKSVDENNVWMFKLLKVIWDGTDFPQTPYFDTYQFDENDEGETPSVEQFGVVNIEQKDQEEMKKRLSSICPDATIAFLDQATGISLNMEMDEKFPENCTSLAKKIYEESDFEKSSFDLLVIYFIEEKNEEGERARIFFSKNYKDIDDKDKGYIDAYGIFLGGRVEKYKNKIKNIIDHDSFYKKMTEDEFSWTWDWE